MKTTSVFNILEILMFTNLIEFPVYMTSCVIKYCVFICNKKKDWRSKIKEKINLRATF